MIKHLFNGRTLPMIAEEHGLSYHQLYRLIVMRGVPVTKAINFLLAEKEMKASKSTPKGAMKCA